jgi:hypothetical protein
MLSGEVWNSTVELSVPVVESVIRQLTQGVFPLTLELEAPTRFPVNVRVKLQSVAWAYAGWGRRGLWWLVKVHTATRARRTKGRTLRRLVMPIIVDLLGGPGKGEGA